MRGGKRAGAGRPKKTSETRKKVQITIDAELAEKLPVQPSKLISKLLRDYYDSQKPF